MTFCLPLKAPMEKNRTKKNSQKRKIAKKSISDQNDKVVAWERLSRNYNISSVEILLQYGKFMQKNENGEISKERFLSEEKVHIYVL